MVGLRNLAESLLTQSQLRHKSAELKCGYPRLFPRAFNFVNKDKVLVFKLFWSQSHLIAICMIRWASRIGGIADTSLRHPVLALKYLHWSRQLQTTVTSSIQRSDWIAVAIFLSCLYKHRGGARIPLNSVGDISWTKNRSKRVLMCRWVYRCISSWLFYGEGLPQRLSSARLSLLKTSVIWSSPAQSPQL